MKKSLRIRRILFIAALAIVVLLVLAISPRRNPKIPKMRRVKGINSLITNQMSDSLGLEKLDRDINTFMQRWWIRGLSLSVMRGDSLLYAKGYGKADENREMGPGNIMRIASISKLLTAAGIMKLQEEGKLHLSDKVFGPSGILLRRSLYRSH